MPAGFLSLIASASRPGIAYSLRQFRWLLRSGKTLCLIAEDDDALAGFAIAQHTSIGKSPGGHIITIDVAPDFRRRGVGRMLMVQIEDRLRTLGAGWLRLEVAENNSAASEFYAWTWICDDRPNSRLLRRRGRCHCDGEVAGRAGSLSFHETIRSGRNLSGHWVYS